MKLAVGLFLDALGEQCTCGSVQGRAMLDIASETYMLGMRDVTRTLYTITASIREFGTFKEGAIFTIDGNNYKCTKPPIIKQDAIIFVCFKA